MASSQRSSSISRTTSETDIRLELNVDGTGVSSINTGIPIFDHMLTLFSKHGRFDLTVEAKGDIEIDFHHTIEDVGIVLGSAFAEAVGDKKGIFRYGSGMYPMDESLVRVSLDVGGRPFLDYRAPENVPHIGDKFNFTLVEEFLRAFAFKALINLHVAILYGRDPHHMAEGTFKGLARSLDDATQIDKRIADVVPSTKDVL
ncbi:MAG: imidazoleglycerol-phosphate dehydratase [Verrucomicrobiales bacterium]|jgi:imidazoleglycerol-phosphate dehydratase|nr:imidazoleglycerol-phosphate dehydratase [Verrucomicrobiales bacterium]|tara:strand:+ start:3724 stop:4326 length:603 start_codon:yes stop_codon:yes gene_type:complete